MASSVGIVGMGALPQWDFLNFLRESGKRFASFKVMMSAEAVDLIRDGERITGVKAKTPDGAIDIEADLAIACDGRHSLVRERAGHEVEEIGACWRRSWRAAARPRTNSTRCAGAGNFR
jgi:2-polyprenyl-6-methoxyphenol hydroxylase-like FAD-dependent oxidoreductase